MPMTNHQHKHTPESGTPRQSFAAKVLDRIEEEKVIPRARWHFLLRNVVLWSLWIASVVVGAMAVAAAIFFVMNFQWRLYMATHESLSSFVVASLPYAWIVTLILFTLLAYENIRHTKRGYRYPLWVIVALNITGSALGGVVLYAVGGGQFVDETIGGRIPMHRPFFAMEKERWMQPERGLLAGAVEGVHDEQGTLTLRAFDATEWTIETASLHDIDWKVINDFSEVRIVGVPVATTTSDGSHERLLHACFVLPWEVHGRMGPVPPPPVGFGERPRGGMKRMIAERNEGEERSNECKDVRLYETLQALRHSENPNQQ